MILLVKSCKDPKAWYAKLVNCNLPYLGCMQTGWKTKDQFGNISYIPFHDAEIIQNL